MEHNNDNIFEQVKKSIEGKSGIDPELLPYIEEADRDDSSDLDLDTDADDDKQLDKALTELVKSSLLSGPLDDIVDEVSHAKPVDTHQRELDKLAEQQRDKQDYLRIYNQLTQRKAEHRPNPSLDRIQRVMQYMGDPHDAYRSIHITGTNGKTSVTRMIDALLLEQGIRTGRFTSPHLHYATERITMDGEPLTFRQFVDAYNDVADIIDLVDQEFAARGEGPMSFFEVLTAMAYQAFADKPIDTAVVEVGMGGRWDCTNVINSQVQVITPIAIDHTRFLGKTRAEIAHIKAGIIKEGSIVIVGPQTDEVDAIINAEAAKKHALVRRFGTDFTLDDRQLGVGGQMLTVTTPAGQYEDIFVPLFGRHQAVNAAIALAATEAFLGGGAMNEEVVEHGFQAVTSPGRLEVVRTSPTVIVDACHNPHGAQSLVDALGESFNFATKVGIYSAMDDKDIEGVLSVLEPTLDELVVVEMPGERGASLQKLRDIASDVFGAERVHVVDDQLTYYDSIAQAITVAADLAEVDDSPGHHGGIIAFGSVAFVADVRKVCGKE